MGEFDFSKKTHLEECKKAVVVLVVQIRSKDSDEEGLCFTAFIVRPEAFLQYSEVLYEMVELSVVHENR